MLLSLVYAVVRARLDQLLVRTSTGRAQAAELLALRHEVRVLRRQVKRTQWRAGDRLLLAAPLRATRGVVALARPAGDAAALAP